ncbi:MAG TPA: hypothetical protein VJP86_05675 [Vicinamibacterales bacterium]|jgi:hypothetical protein|nr:hypothetical protein [Vicinamibacterales bacterium]
MIRILIKSALLEVDGRVYPARFFELHTARGSRRFSAEILLAPNDRIILDDDSIVNLEARALRLVPATVQSRSLTRPAA